MCTESRLRFSAAAQANLESWSEDFGEKGQFGFPNLRANKFHFIPFTSLCLVSDVRETEAQIVDRKKLAWCKLNESYIPRKESKGQGPLNVFDSLSNLGKPVTLKLSKTSVNPATWYWMIQCNDGVKVKARESPFSCRRALGGQPRI